MNENRGADQLKPTKVIYENDLKHLSPQSPRSPWSALTLKFDPSVTKGSKERGVSRKSLGSFSNPDSNAKDHAL